MNSPPLVRADAFGVPCSLIAFCIGASKSRGPDGSVGVGAAVALPSKMSIRFTGPQLAPSLGVVAEEFPRPGAVSGTALWGKLIESPCHCLRGCLGGTRSPYFAAVALDHILVGTVAQRPQLRDHLLASKRRMLPRDANGLSLNQELAIRHGLWPAAQGRATDLEPTANGSHGPGQRGLDLRRSLGLGGFYNAISVALDLSIWSESSFSRSMFSISRSRSLYP